MKLSQLISTLQSALDQHGDAEHVALSYIVDGSPAHRFDIFGDITVLQDTANYPNGVAYVIAEQPKQPRHGRRFAKLFETHLGQIVVMRQHGDDGPEVNTYFDPGIEELSFCHISLEFSDDEEGWEKADAALDFITEEYAISVVTNQIEHIKSMFKGGE